MTKGIRKLFLGLFLVAIVSISCQVQAKAADYTISGLSGSVTLDNSKLPDPDAGTAKLSVKYSGATSKYKDITTFTYADSSWSKGADSCGMTVTLSGSGVTVSTSDIAAQVGALFSENVINGERIQLCIRYDDNPANDDNVGDEYVCVLTKPISCSKDDSNISSKYNVKVTDTLYSGYVFGNKYTYAITDYTPNDKEIITWSEAGRESLAGDNLSATYLQSAESIKATIKYDVVKEVKFNLPLEFKVGEEKDFALYDIESEFGSYRAESSKWTFGDVKLSSIDQASLGLTGTAGRYSVKPTATGEYKIKATIEDGECPGEPWIDSYIVKVTDDSKVLTGIDIVEASLSVGIGSENAKELTLKPLPETAELDYDKITAGTDNETIAKATVDKANKKITVEGIAAGTAKVTVKYNGDEEFSDTCDVTVTGDPTGTPTPTPTPTPDPGAKVVVDFDSLKITIPTSTSVLSKVNGAQIIADIDGTNYYYSGSAWKTAATNVTFKSSGTSETITLGATTVTSMLKLLGKTLKAEKIDIDNVTITVIPYSSTDKKTDAAAEGSSDIDSYWIELDTSENAESYKVDDVETKDYFYGFPGLSYTIVASGKSGYTFKKWDGYEEKTNTLTYYPMEDATLTAIFTKGGTPGGDGEAVVSLNAADMYIKVPATAAGMTENVTGVVLLASTGAVNYEYNGSGWVKVASATPNPYYCLSVSGSLTTGYYEMASSSVRSMLKSLGWQLKNDGVDASVISLYAFPCNKESLAVDATKYATNFDTILMSKISLSYEKNAAAYIVDSSTMSSSSNAYFNAFYGLTYSVISQGSSSFRFSKWDGDTSHMSNTTSSSMTYSAPNAAQSVTAVYESSSSSSSSSSMRTSSSSSSSSSMTRGGSGSGSGDYDEVPKTGESKTDIWILWGVLFASILGAGFMIYKRFGLVKAIARAEEDEAKEAMAAEQKAKEDRINMITDLRNLK